MTEKIEFEATPTFTHIGGGFAWSGHVIKLPPDVDKQKYRVTLEPVEMKPKPCPHCAGEARMQTRRRAYPYHFVMCEDPACEAKGPESESKAIALRGWNRRDGYVRED